MNEILSKTLLQSSNVYEINEVVFESTAAGTYNIEIKSTGIYEIICIGGGGPAAMRGRYDDRGYGWSGGSGAGFIGTFRLSAGIYEAEVGSANNNTKAQGGNTNTLNPTDLTAHDSYITGILTVGGGGYGYYNPSHVGAGGAAPILELTPIETTLNVPGNAGRYGSGGKGSGANATMQGGDPVYEQYGKGQGCSTSEYAARRYWINGNDGYIKVTYKR